ncbi:MAG: oligosaccharide flippase family protein [Candidatus Paceibacterota bacterium]
MKKKFFKILKWSERYAKTDMTYVGKGGFWLALAKGGSIIISFLLMVAFANWLPQEEFGIYQFVLSVVGILTVFSLPGINTSLTKSIAKNKEGALKEVFKTKIKWGLLGSLVIFCVSAWYFLNGNNILGLSFFMAGIFFSPNKAFEIFSAYWNGKKRFDMYSKYSIYSGTLATLLLIGTIYITDNVALIITAFFGGYAIFNFIFYWLTQKQVENSETDVETVPYGKSLTIMRFLGGLSHEIDRIILWKFLGPVQVAIYSFAILPINKIINSVPIPTLALPKLSEKKIERTRKKGLIDKFWRLMIIIIPVTIILILIAPLVYRLAFPQYMDSVIYFQILSIMLLSFPFTLLNTALIAETKKKELYMIKTIPPVIKILLFIVLIPLYGILGAVIALLIGKAIQNGMEFYYFKTI